MIHALADAGMTTVNLDIDSESAHQKFPPGNLFEECDIRDSAALGRVFNKYSFEGVIHLAALKSVEESQSNPKEYFETNVQGTKNVLNSMLEHGTHKIIFSSSAAVYQARVSEYLVSESSRLDPVSYYGQTKLDSEVLIQNFSRTMNNSSVIFRYFNVAGSANSKLRDNSIQNLIPITISRVKSGMSPEIFGDDYETPDGTAIRDYVDVRDIADAHLKAIRYLSLNSKSWVLNIGTGRGASVKEVIAITQEVMGTKIPVVIGSRRSGDISAIAADCRKASEIIGFRAKYNLREMIETSI